MDDHVVVTRARMRNSRRRITHTYGPYPKSRARRIKRALKMEAELAGHELEVSVCRLLKPESWISVDGVVKR